MGLLSSIGNIASKVITAVTPTKEKISNVGAVLNAALNPFSKSTVVANVSNPVLKTALETVANHPYATAAVVAAPVAIAKSPAVREVVKRAAGSIVPTSTIGKVATVAAIPAVAGAVATKPLESAKALISAPENLANFGSNAATLISEPTKENLKTLINENPIISSGVALGAGAAIVSVAAPVVGGLLTREAIKDQTDIIAKAIGESNPMPTSSGQVLTSSPTASAVPVTPETKPLIATAGGGSTSTSKRRKRTPKTPLMPSVRQNVNILVQNKSSSVGIKQTKRYINKEILAY